MEGGNDNRAHAEDYLGMVVALRRQGGCKEWDWNEVVICSKRIVVRRGSRDIRDEQSRSGRVKGNDEVMGEVGRGRQGRPMRVPARLTFLSVVAEIVGRARQRRGDGAAMVVTGKARTMSICQPAGEVVEGPGSGLVGTLSSRLDVIV